MIRSNILSLLLVITVISVSAQAPRENPRLQLLFQVAKSPVYTKEFLQLYRKNHQNKPDDFTQPKIQEVMDLFIKFKLKIAEATHRGLDTTLKFRKEFKTYRDELKRPYLASPDLLTSLTHEAYDRLTKEINASHILILVKPDASPADSLKAYTKISAIRNRIMQGEDFDKLARENSEDPSAKTNGGNLGYFTALQMVYPFENVTYRTPVGSVSPIFRTRFGYHIVKVLNQRNSRGEVEVSHILIRNGGPNKDKIKNLIFEIYDQIKAGRDWNELCKEYSEDTNTKNNGGRLRPFGAGVFASVPEFEATAFGLERPGQISDPFQSAIGWHIIRLEKKIPISVYSEMEATLKKRITKDERMKISESENQLKRKRDFKFSENKDIKNRIFELADSSLMKGQWKFKGQNDLRSLFIFSLDDKFVTVQDFIKYLDQNQQPGGLPPAFIINQYYDEFVEERMDEMEESKLASTNPEFKSLLKEYREGILLFEIMEKEVWNKSSTDTIGQKVFYQTHLKKYVAGNRVEARIFATPDSVFLSDIKKKINNGDTLSTAELKKFKSLQNYRKYEKGESKIMDKVDWVPGIQQAKADGIYYLVEIRKLIAPGEKTLEDSRSAVISDYQNDLEAEWIGSLRKKYPIKISKSGVKAVMTELIKK